MSFNFARACPTDKISNPPSKNACWKVYVEGTSKFLGIIKEQFAYNAKRKAMLRFRRSDITLVLKDKK